MPALSDHRTRLVADAVISAYLIEISPRRAARPEPAPVARPEAAPAIPLASETIRPAAPRRTAKRRCSGRTHRRPAGDLVGA